MAEAFIIASYSGPELASITFSTTVAVPATVVPIGARILVLRGGGSGNTFGISDVSGITWAPGSGAGRAQGGAPVAGIPAGNDFTITTPSPSGTVDFVIYAVLGTTAAAGEAGFSSATEGTYTPLQGVPIVNMPDGNLVLLVGWASMVPSTSFAPLAPWITDYSSPQLVTGQRQVEGDGATDFYWEGNAVVGVFPAGISLQMFSYGIFGGNGVIASVVDAARQRKWIAREFGGDIRLNPYTLNSGGRWLAGADVTLSGRSQPSLEKLPDGSVSLLYEQGGDIKCSRYTVTVGERYVQTVASLGTLPAHVIDYLGRLVCVYWAGSNYSVVVGTLNADGSTYTFSSPVSLAVSNPLARRGSLEVTPANAFQFTYENGSNVLSIVTCRNLLDTGVGTWAV